MRFVFLLFCLILAVSLNAQTHGDSILSEDSLLKAVEKLDGWWMYVGNYEAGNLKHFKKDSVRISNKKNVHMMSLIFGEDKLGLQESFNYRKESGKYLWETCQPCIECISWHGKLAIKRVYMTGCDIFQIDQISDEVLRLKVVAYLVASQKEELINTGSEALYLRYPAWQ